MIICIGFYQKTVVFLENKNHPLLSGICNTA